MNERPPFIVKAETFTPGGTSPKMAVAKVNDLIPSFRPKPSMISDERKGKRHVEESTSHADVGWAGGIIFGTPTRFGNTSAELKAFIDSLGSLWFQGKLNGKPAGAFTSTAGPHGGNETTVVSLFLPMADLGFIIVPTGYTHEMIAEGHGTPYGASSISGQTSNPPTQNDLRSPSIRGHESVRLLEL